MSDAFPHDDLLTQPPARNIRATLERHDASGVDSDVFETRDGCRLAYVDEGHGLPVLWQHGLGADRAQAAEVFPAIEGVRRITLECRGHGRSGLGNADALSIEQFADDAIELLDLLGIERVVVGGISLGAAIALRLAVCHPDRCVGLVLARPAWADEAAPTYLRIYTEVAKYLAEDGPVDGAQRLESSGLLHEVEAVSPDNAASLRGFFARPHPVSTIELLSRIPLQGPRVSRAQIQALAVPTLVIANRQDHVHPVATAHTLVSLIAGAAFELIPSKTVSRGDYVRAFRAAMHTFLVSLRSLP